MPAGSGLGRARLRTPRTSGNRASPGSCSSCRLRPVTLLRPFAPYYLQSQARSGVPSGWSTAIATLSHARTPVKRDRPDGLGGRQPCVLRGLDPSLIPGRRLAGLSRDALVKRRALPRVPPWRGPGPHRRGLTHESLERGDDRGRLLGRGVWSHDRELWPPVRHPARLPRGRCYSGMLPCLRFGPATRLFCSVSSAVISFGRVSCGMITSSM
jgi:hypothetical protein